jgi:hypothetical protein
MSVPVIKAARQGQQQDLDVEPDIPVLKVEKIMFNTLFN